MNQTTVVLKVGGSIISPSEDNIFDWDYVQKFKAKLMEISDDYKFVLVCGGGALARKYQQMVKDKGGTNREMDWVGTSACNHNATMMRVALGDDSMDVTLIGNDLVEQESLNFEKTFMCVGALEPGHSSDLDAVIMASRSGNGLILSMKNIDGVYTADPNKDPSAKKIDKITWDDYEDVIQVDEFTPKLALPVDPIAADKAEDENMNFIILDGRDLDNLVKAIKAQDYIGTLIY